MCETFNSSVESRTLNGQSLEVAGTNTPCFGALCLRLCLCLVDQIAGLDALVGGGGLGGGPVVRYRTQSERLLKLQEASGGLCGLSCLPHRRYVPSAS